MEQSNNWDQQEIQDQKDKMIKDIKWNIEYYAEKLKAHTIQLELLTNITK